MQTRSGHVIPVTHASLGGMCRNHEMAGVVEQEILQEVVGFVPGKGLVSLMVRQLLLDGLEQSAVDNGRLFAWEDLTPVFDFPDEEPIAQKVGEGTSAEGNASADLAGTEGPRLGIDVPCPEVPDQLVDA